MKNVLIVLGVAAGVYGAYLWLGNRKKEDEDCGCTSTASSATTSGAGPAIEMVDTAMMPDVIRKEYDSSFNSAFHGRGSSGPIGATSTEWAAASMIGDSL